MVNKMELNLKINIRIKFKIDNISVINLKFKKI